MKARIDGLVSVIMPAYNAELYISTSIESVLSQKYQNIELIIVDDCSTDSTRSILMGYKNKVKVILLDRNVGVAEARNVGIDYSNGQYISFLDSDDVWLPEKIQKQLDLLRSVGGVCSHTSYIRFSDSKDSTNIVVAKPKVTFSDMLKGNQIGNLTGLYDASYLGVFKQKKIGHEDYLMWLSILKNTDSFGVEKPLAMYRVREGSVSSNKIKAIQWQFKILKTEMKQNSIASLYYLSIYICKSVLKRCRFFG